MEGCGFCIVEIECLVQFIDFYGVIGDVLHYKHIGKRLNLNEATDRTIKKNVKGIRSVVAAGSLIFAKYTPRPRAPIIEKMEKALSIWIDGNCQKRIPLDGNIIK